MGAVNNLVTLDDWRAAVSHVTPDDMKSVETDVGGRFTIAPGGDKMENVRVRQQLVAALGTDSRIPKSYLDSVRARLGLDTPELDAAAGKPLDARDVKDILDTAKALDGFVDVETEMLLQKTESIVKAQSQGLLTRELDEAMADVMAEVDKLCEGVQNNYAREQVVQRFAEMTRRMAQQCMDSALGVALTADPEDAEVAAKVVEDSLRFLRELREMVVEARTNPSFDFDKVSWPNPPDFGKWDAYKASRAEAKAAERRQKSDRRTARTERKAAREALAQLNAILQKIAAMLAAPKKDGELKAGSTGAVALALYVDTMKSIAQNHADAERRELESKIQGFRKRLSARMGFAADDVKVKV